MNALKVANDVLAFLLEIAAVVAVAGWGFRFDGPVLVRVVLGLGAPAALIAVWAVWLAPMAANRLDLPWLVVAKVVVFGLAALAIAVVVGSRLAVVFGVLVVLNLVLSVVWGRA